MEVKEKRTYISPNVVTVAPFGTEGSLLDNLQQGSQAPEADAKYHTSYSLWEDDEEESYE